MRLEWVIEPNDAAKVSDLVARSESERLVQERRQRNLGQPRPHISRSPTWQVMVGCLLTTQQKSGPGKPVARFLETDPFRLAYDLCCQKSDLRAFALRTISDFRGIRRGPTVAGQLAANFAYLEAGNWVTLLERLAQTDASNDGMFERSAAHYIADSLKGFGPKQARNFLQWVGVSKHEIPIDSRVTKWLNKELLSFRLNAAMLADHVYYDMVSDGVIRLCEMAGVIPCVFDAAVFASFDKSPVSTSQPQTLGV